MTLTSFNKKIQILRARLAIAVFPGRGFRIVANRRELVFDTPKIECRFVIRNKTKPDGYSWEEMIGILDVFLGRQTTDEEWRQILAWKNRPGKEAA